jgi:type I restriction enzyme S subunit
MRKGDVLFGKRRAYQKKVAIAPFDGDYLRPKDRSKRMEFFIRTIK